MSELMCVKLLKGETEIVRADYFRNCDFKGDRLFFKTCLKRVRADGLHILASILPCGSHLDISIKALSDPQQDSTVQAGLKAAKSVQISILFTSFIEMCCKPIYASLSCLCAHVLYRWLLPECVHTRVQT